MAGKETKEQSVRATAGTGWVLWAWIVLLLAFAAFAALKFLHG